MFKHQIKFQILLYAGLAAVARSALLSKVIGFIEALGDANL